MADQIMVRLPQGMRDALQARAFDSGRSMNMVVIVALKQYLDQRGDTEARQAELLAFVEKNLPVLKKLCDRHVDDDIFPF